MDNTEGISEANVLRDEETLIPSDAFGVVKFEEYTCKTAKFVRVYDKTPAKTMIHLMTQLWNLSLPKLLISVNGKRNDFQLNLFTKEALGRGLVKAARITGAWIISEGLHNGVSKCIGKAIHDNEGMSAEDNKVVTIGIAPWNCVQNKKSLVKKEGSWPAKYEITEASNTGMYALDPNHSHFILVDDGTSNTFGQELEFRKALEDYIRVLENKNVKIPAVAVMIGGGPETLKSVCDSISRNIPVIIVKGSGGAADIMEYAYQRKIGNEDEKDENKTESSLQMQLENKIKNKIMKEFEYNKQIESLVKCVLDSLKQPNLVTIFEIDSAEEFDVAVLKALSKANNNKSENLSLALEWNRIDIAKNELFTEDILWPESETDHMFTKIFGEHMFKDHSGYTYGYKKEVRYSIKNYRVSRIIKYRIPKYKIEICALDDVKEWIQKDIKLRKARDGEASSPCNAFGELKFAEYSQKIAKFVRVDHKTSMGIIMYLTTVFWKLSLPNLIISVTGGREDFQLTPQFKTFLAHGLVKVAKTRGAWIISEGLRTGVSRCIGKAIHDDVGMSADDNTVVTIGIAPWNCVQNKESLVNEEGSWPAEYHIKDDSNTNTFALDPNHSHFILVDNGTQDTSGIETEFRRIFENTIAEMNIPETEFKIPAVAVMFEGGLETLESVCDSISRNIPVIIVKGSGGATDIMTNAYEAEYGNKDGPKQKDTGEDIKNEIIQKFEINKDTNEKKIDHFVECVSMSLKRPNLLTLYDLDSDEDFDVAIMKAVFKAKNKSKNLKIKKKWERIDKALNKLFADRTNWKTGTLDNFMLSALREDRVDLVKPFQEHGVSLTEFLTEEHTKSLYSMENKEGSFEQTYGRLERPDEIADLPFATKLFIWAVLFDRKEMAFLLWKEGKDALPSALIANKLLKSLKEKCKDYDQKMIIQKYADLYEENSIGLLTECYNAEKENTLDLLLLQRETYNTSCMQLAYTDKNENFKSQPACQSLLSKIWKGSMDESNNIWKLLLCTLCPFLIFLMIDFDDENKNNSKGNNKSSCSNTWWKRCKFVKFYTTPVIKFLINFIFYIIFLCIYSYVLLVELKPQISYLEWLLLVWVISIFTEELHQLFTESSKSLYSKFKKYIYDIWNIIDVVTILLFIGGYILRFLKLHNAARVMLCLNLIFFYIRFLNMLSVHEHIGPKLVMIKKMMQDLGYFIIILFVFMTAFGIASQSILSPSTPVSYELLKSVFKKGYFQMYGELFLDEYDGDIHCNVTESICPTEITSDIAVILMCIYILLTNILLLNLLIAMFSYTFQKVQEKTNFHWSLQRYDLISEFHVRDPLPPPFILISNICRVFLYLFTILEKQKEEEHVFVKKYDPTKEEELIDWEDTMVNLYSPTQNKSDSENKKLIDQLTSKVEEQVCVLSSRTDQLTSKVEELQINVEEKMKNVDKIDTILALLNEMHEELQL